MTDVVALAAELLAIQSSTGNEGPAVDFIARWLIARGWNVTTQEVTKGRANVWASRSGNGVTFSTHLDTVPPYIPPRLEKKRLHGRGACDAKGIAAAMLCA
ncbi:MAG: M20/M25/M40 family metallo-hydrolase, partial [bacterium]